MLPGFREEFLRKATERGVDEEAAEKIWYAVTQFASFGFCKAHAAAFALPTYQSAWLKAHHPAAFLAGVLTHDPGMYPKRLILDDARSLGIAVLGLDVNVSDATYRVEKLPADLLDRPAEPPPADLPDGRRYGIRLSLADVKGISDAEVARVVAGRPYHSLSDFWHRARVSRPVVERLIVAGGFDDLYGLGARLPVRRRSRVTRRDLLLQLADLDRWTRSARPARPAPRIPGQTGPTGMADAVRVAAARQSQAPREVPPLQAHPVQLALDLGDAPGSVEPSGLPEMTGAERVRAELEVLGLDATRHVVDFYEPFLAALRVTRAPDMVRSRSQAEVLVAGVKVATQTPPIRSGKRVVFVTLDDARGPIDATFFEDAQGPYAATLFHSWLLVIRGHVRRTGPRGVSMRATGCWELPELHAAWLAGGLDAVAAVMAASGPVTDRSVAGAAESRSTRPVMTRPPLGGSAEVYEPREVGKAGSAGGMGRPRRVLVHASGFRQSPYADIKTPGESGDDARAAARKEAAKAPRKLWHSSPGSSGG
jgi:error-prone DNA polymerase